MNPQRALAGAALAATLIVTGGCGAVAEKAADKAAEKAIESNTGGKAKIEDGKIKVTDKDGNTVEVDGEGGTFKSSGKDGDTNYTVGDGATLPDGWPSELNPPPGTKLTAASTTDSPTGGKQMLVTGTVDGDVKSVYEGIKQQLADGEYTIDSDNFLQATTGDLGTLSAKNSKWKVTVAVAAGTDSGTSSVTMTVDPVS